MKAIETTYNGYRFRSRLEARWAVFMEHLHIKYVYEREGFELSTGDRYLPDFWLPEVHFRWDREPGVWLEIKGVLSADDDRIIQQFSIDQREPICIAVGDYFSGRWTVGDSIQHYKYDPAFEGQDGIWWDQGVAFMTCTQCSRTSIQFVESSYAECERCKSKAEFVHESHPAFLAARAARFEFNFRY